MKIYEKPMAIINRFEVEDVIAASDITEKGIANYVSPEVAAKADDATQGVIFTW